MEKDQDLLEKLLSKGEAASRTAVDLETQSVRVLEAPVMLEVTDDAYGTVAPPPPPPPVGTQVVVSLGEKKKRHRHHSKKKGQAALESQVTYTGKDVSGDLAPSPKKQKTLSGGLAPSLSMLAPPVPTITRTPIRQVLDEYGCADEKFVRAMIRDLKGIDLDRVRFKEGSPAESRRIAREHLMKALFAVHSIDASEDTPELKEQVAKLNGHVSYLQTEKRSLEKEKNALAEKLAMMQLHVQELEGKIQRVPELEAEAESLRSVIEKLRAGAAALESKLRERESELAETERLVPSLCDQAVAEYKESQELKDLLKAARDDAITEKFTEWSEHGYLDKPRMMADLLAAKAKSNAQGSKAAPAEGSPGPNVEIVGDDEASDSEEDELSVSAEKDQA